MPDFWLNLMKVAKAGEPLLHVTRRALMDVSHPGFEDSSLRLSDR